MATVSDVMTRDILTVARGATLGQVARELRARNVGSALVVDEAHALVGIITERELVNSVAASRNPDVGLVESWMIAAATSVEATSSLAEASGLMRVHSVRHLPVTEDGRLVGIVSVRDLLAATL